jgi:transcriptional regulator with GAF, ATPase, and Fis domain
LIKKIKKIKNMDKKQATLSLKYEISLAVLIPAIFSGISIFSFIIGLNINKDLDNTISKYIWGSLVGVSGFFCGSIIFWLLMKPIKKFVENAKSLSFFQKDYAPNSLSDQSEKKFKGEIEQYSYILNQATAIMGKIKSSQLFPNIVGHCKVMRSLFTQILKVAPTDTSVLILGETGTGKELIADSVYDQSLRAQQPLVKINCAAIPDDLLENELFGHEKGAFTGASEKKIGKFELAHKGTIFLDEIGDISPSLQAKLLRVLQEKEYTRLGSNKTLKIDARFIFATNKNLSKLVENSKFREDLFHRLNVFPLIVPPLRERSDIPILSYHFLKNSPVVDSKILKISSQTLHYLESYSWPGNVRELENTIQRAAILTETNTIDTEHLPHTILQNRNSNKVQYSDTADPILQDDISIDEHLRGVEKKMIISALIRTQGKQTEAAALLNIKQRSLWHRIKKYQINVISLKKNIKI